MGCSRPRGLSLLLLISSLFPSALGLARALDASVIMNSIQPRASNDCAANNLTACPTGVNFCCPQKTTCISLTSSNDSVLCCPDGAQCNFIQPIDCDIQLQNSTSHPQNMLHTTKLNETLPSCGNGCCPFGYQCGNTGCYVDSLSPGANNNASSQPQTIPSATTSSAFLIPTAASEPPAAITTPPAQPQPDPNRWPTRAIVLGLSLGILAGAAITLVIVYCCIRKKRRGVEKDMVCDGERSPDFMGKTPQPIYSIHTRSNSAPTVISEPAWAPEYGGSHRTDFLLRRGDAETSYEQTTKPAWSTASDRSVKELDTSPPAAEIPARSLSRSTTAPAGKLPSLQTTGPQLMERGRSGTSLRSKFTEITSPVTPPNPPTQPMRMKSTSKRSPLFASPLKLGLPSSPGQPLRRVKPRQPLRMEMRMNSNGSVATSSKHSTSTKSSSKKRDESQQRPLVAKGDGTGHGESENNSLIRTDSDASDASRTPRGLKRTATSDSTETINVLMPPPAIFDRDARHESSKTTFTQLMEQAGWKGGEPYVVPGVDTPKR